MMNVKRGLIGVALLAALVSMTAEVQAQGLHGIRIAKGCSGPVCEGAATSCIVEFGYNDNFGDTIRIHEAWDVEDFNGDKVRVPAAGNLPIVTIGGNTTCTVGGGLPCEIGPGGSTLSGLPGEPDPGFVRFRQDTYIVQPDDATPLSDQATVIWQDLCDDPGTSGCGAGILNQAPAPAATPITRCDDGDPCTLDVCEAGVCSFPPLDCNDGDACTDDSCFEGICVHDVRPCDDGDACTTEACDSATGECAVTDEVDCNDGDACTDDVCDPATGECDHTPNYDCDDGDACTEDSCDPSTGECVHSDPPDCDDGDACTDDVCDPATGECDHTPNYDCDDGDACTEDSCDSATGACVHSAPRDCDDGDRCTDDRCVPETGDCENIVIDPPPIGCGLACRVTGGGVDTTSTLLSHGQLKKYDPSYAEGQDTGGGSVNRYTMGGQAGAPTAEQPQPYGEWTHHNQRGSSGRFVFHAGTASAPSPTEIDLIECSDPDWCVQARPAPAKQIDFEGIGTFKNMDHKAEASFLDADPAGSFIAGKTFHWFSVHIEDLGEPGQGGKVEPPSDICPVAGSAGALANCECPDFYTITIHANADPSSAVVYHVFGYITGGNLQIHPPILRPGR